MSTGRILLVDDEAPIRLVLSTYLRRLGYAVDEASEGAEAVRFLEDAAGGRRYDLIISDLRMPGLDGEQLYRRLESRGDGMQHRLVFITGDTASPDTARILQITGVPVLLKPFPLPELGRAVARQLAGA